MNPTPSATSSRSSSLAAEWDSGHPISGSLRPGCANPTFPRVTRPPPPPRDAVLTYDREWARRVKIAGCDTGEAGPMRVLLVEDDELLRSLTARILRGLGHDVMEARGTRAALELLKSQDTPVDVLFTDVKLGGSSDGIDLARRAIDLVASLRVLLTSGDPSSFRTSLLPGDRVRLLPKPYRKDQIREAFEALIQAAPSGHQ